MCTLCVQAVIWRVDTVEENQQVEWCQMEAKWDTVLMHRAEHPYRQWFQMWSVRGNASEYKGIVTWQPQWGGRENFNPEPVPKVKCLRSLGWGESGVRRQGMSHTGDRRWHSTSSGDMRESEYQHGWSEGCAAGLGFIKGSLEAEYRERKEELYTLVSSRSSETKSGIFKIVMNYFPVHGNEGESLSPRVLPPGCDFTRVLPACASSALLPLVRLSWGEWSQMCVLQ